MTVASELIKLKDNLTDSYTAVENKGGTLPQYKNFDNLPDAIDSITTGGIIDSLNITPTTSQQIITASGSTDGYSPITVEAVTSSIDANIVSSNIKDGVTILGVTGDYQGSGGDIIFLPNESSETINAGDKVLFNLGSTGTDTPTTFTHANSSQFAPIILFDNNSFVTSDDNSGWLYEYNNSTWTSVSNSLYQQWGFSRFITNHGTVGLSAYGWGTSSSGKIYNKSGSKDLGNYHYIGRINNPEYRDYVINSGDYSVYQYDLSSNTVGSSVASLYTDTYRYLTWGYIDGSFNKCIISNSQKIVEIFDIDRTTGIFTSLKRIQMDAYPIYATGLSIGDIILATDVLADSHPSDSSHLYCYKIMSDYSIVKANAPELKQFENTICHFYYDNISQILSIGTTNGVYCYKFNSFNKTFSNYNINIATLPNNPSNKPYYVVMTPDENKVIVLGYGNYTSIYQISSIYHRIVDNNSTMYDSNTSFTGKATGNTDGQGNYEILTVLPPVLDYQIALQNGTADEVSVYGGAE